MNLNKGLNALAKPPVLSGLFVPDFVSGVMREMMVSSFIWCSEYHSAPVGLSFEPPRAFGNYVQRSLLAELRELAYSLFLCRTGGGSGMVSIVAFGHAKHDGFSRSCV